MFSADECEEPGAAASASGRDDPRSGRPIDAVRLSWALRRRWRTIALAIAVGLPLGAVIAKTLVPRTFQSQSVLVWEPPRGRVIMDPERELKTLVDTIKLPNNLAEVRRRTDQRTTLEALGRQIEVDVGRDSNLLSLRGEAGDGEEAQRLIQAMTQVFLDSRVGLEKARAQDRLRGLSEQVEHIQAQLATARERYDRFRTEHGIADLTIERQAAIEEAALLRTEVYRNRIAVESEDAKVSLLRSKTHREPSEVVLSETQTRAEERKLAELRAELAARGASLSGEHPEVLGLSAAVTALEGRARDYSPSDRVVGTNPQLTYLRTSLMAADVEREAAQKKWRSYSALELSAHDRVTKLTAVEGQASLMLAEIRVAETRLGELETQQKLAEGERDQPVAEFRVLTPADLPSRPARSHRRLVVLGLPLVFGLIATGFCAGQSLRGLKVWTPSEIAFWGRGPVVGASSWPAKADGLEDLALDLRGLLEKAGGTTLLLALAPAQVARAAELASHLEQPPVSSREGVPNRDGALEVWDGPERPQALRRAARQSTRVLVLVEAGVHSVFELVAVRQLLGREDRLGFVVLGLGTPFAELSDRVGDVPGFWSHPGDPPRPMRPPPQSMEC